MSDVSDRLKKFHGIASSMVPVMHAGMERGGTPEEIIEMCLQTIAALRADGSEAILMSMAVLGAAAGLTEQLSPDRSVLLKAHVAEIGRQLNEIQTAATIRAMEQLAEALRTV